MHGSASPNPLIHFLQAGSKLKEDCEEDDEDEDDKDKEVRGGREEEEGDKLSQLRIASSHLLGAS